MNVSVIVPTYNGRHKISGVLNSLLCQTYVPHEVLVMIDGSTDSTESLVQQFIQDLPLKIVLQENRGRAVIRNKGAMLAEGDLLIFFDDDMRLEPGCIEAHVLHHEKHPGSILTGAQIDDYEKARTDFQNYKCQLSRSWAENLKKQEGQPLPFANLYITAANFSISKELFDKLGGFDERLRDCEDYDLALKAYSFQVPIYYSEAAFGWHDDFQSPYSFIKRQLDYKKYNELLYQLYPDKYGHFLETRLNQPGRLKAAFFSLFKSPVWVKAIEKNYLGFLPKKARYKLYTWIITTHSTYKSHL